MTNDKKTKYNEIVFSEEQEELIVDMYTKQNISTVKIGKIFGVNHHRIAKTLDKYNIPRNHASVRKYSLNEYYFDVIDTPNKAYILGFLYADGCNFPNKTTISMSLEEKDKEVLEKIRLEIGSEKELEFVEQSKRKDKDNDYKYNDCWRLLLFSSHMCETLNKHGMTPRKSLTLQFPKHLDESLLSHFIRGYFDGDGSYCHRYAGSNYGYRDLITITSTESFCKDCLEIIRKETGIGGGIYDASSHNGITKVLSISGTNQVNKFFEWLYKDAELYMKRKHDLYMQHLAA